MANDKHKRARDLPVKPEAARIESEPEDVAPVVEFVPEAAPEIDRVTPETATHVTVATRGQARFPRVGHVFTPRPVELEIARAWPDPIERVDCIRSLVHESRDGCLEVEFFIRER